MGDLLLDPIISFGLDPVISFGWSDHCAGSFPHKHEAAFGDDPDWERTASLSDSDEAMASDRPRGSLSGSERETQRDEGNDVFDLKIDPRTDFSDLDAIATRWRHGCWHGCSSRSIPASGVSPLRDPGGPPPPAATRRGWGTEEEDDDEDDEEPPEENNSYGYGPMQIAMNTASIFRDVVFDEYGIILDEKQSDKRPSRIGEVLKCGPTEIERMEERADRAVEHLAAAAAAAAAGTTGNQQQPSPGSSCRYGLQPLIVGGDCGDIHELYGRWPRLCLDRPPGEEATCTAHRAVSEFYCRGDCGRDETAGGSPPDHHHE